MAIPILKLRDKATGQFDGVPVLIGEPAKLVSQTTEYQLSDSGITPPSGDWLSKPPATVPGKYLWEKITQNWNKGDPKILYFPLYQGQDGAGTVNSVANVRPDPVTHNVPLVPSSIGAAYDHSGAAFANSYIHEYSLGDHLTAEQSEDIRSGEFKLVRVGGYWEINGRKYWAAHADYRLNQGSENVTEHHMLVIPDASLYDDRYNTTATTDSGYLNSEMKTGNLKRALQTVESDFGADHILPYSTILTASASGGTPNNWEWRTNQKIDLMSEQMVYGSQVWGNTATGYNVGIEKVQIALFRAIPSHINIRSGAYWLRDIADATRFCCVFPSGQAMVDVASEWYGVRPAFLVY